MLFTFIGVIQLIGKHVYLGHAQEFGIRAHLGHFSRGLGVLSSVGGNTQDKVCLHRLGFRVKRRVDADLFPFSLASGQGKNQCGAN